MASCEATRHLAPPLGHRPAGSVLFVVVVGGSRAASCVGELSRHRRSNTGSNTLEQCPVASPASSVGSGGVSPERPRVLVHLRMLARLHQRMPSGTFGC